MLSTHALLPFLTTLLLGCGGVLLFFSRVRELLAARMMVDKFLTFSFFAAGTWEALIGAVAKPGGTPFPALSHKRMKHLVVEMFVATKKVGGAFLSSRLCAV